MEGNSWSAAIEGSNRGQQ